MNTITTSDLARIKATMLKYNRTTGFIDFVGGTLTFFDDNPFIDGVSAAFITLSDLNHI